MSVVAAPSGIAVLPLPYDLRERVMLGDAGSNALSAMLGLRSVRRLTEQRCRPALGALAGLTLSGLSALDSLGRQP
jgi:hypothetical protein